MFSGHVQRASDPARWVVGLRAMACSVVMYRGLLMLVPNMA